VHRYCFDWLNNVGLIAVPAHGGQPFQIPFGALHQHQQQQQQQQQQQANNNNNGGLQALLQQLISGATGAIGAAMAPTPPQPPALTQTSQTPSPSPPGMSYPIIHVHAHSYNNVVVTIQQ
jgi:hypothetical protein